MLVITLNQKTEGIRHSAGESLKSDCNFPRFVVLYTCDTISYISCNGVQSCDFVLLFSITGEIVSQQCEVHFRGVLHVVEAHFFYTQKDFFKKF